MGLFGIHKKEVFCPKDVWTPVIVDFGVGMLAEITLTFEANKTGDVQLVSGFIAENYIANFFSLKSVERELQPKMQFRRGWSYLYYTIKVRPSQNDLVVRIKG